MVVLSVIDDNILYNTLKNETEPLGIPYPVFYDFLNCTGISPCATYMSGN